MNDLHTVTRPDELFSQQWPMTATVWELPSSVFVREPVRDGEIETLAAAWKRNFVIGAINIISGTLASPEEAEGADMTLREQFSSALKHWVWTATFLRYRDRRHDQDMSVVDFYPALCETLRQNPADIFTDSGVTLDSLSKELQSVIDAAYDECHNVLTKEDYDGGRTKVTIRPTVDYPPDLRRFLKLPDAGDSR